MMPPILLPVALIAYLVGVFLTILTMSYRSKATRNGASVVFVAAWLAHAAAVVRRVIVTGQFPLSSGAEYLLVLGLVVMTLNLVIWFRWRVDVAGIVLPTVAALAGFAALALLGADPSHQDAPQGWFIFHTTVSTLGMATLVVALAMSVIYIVQDHALKTRKTLRLLERMPSLDRCDNIGFRSLVIGFILLTLGIRGRKSAYLTITGVTVGLLTVIGMTI
jgi:ABC-type uncharacterized transport system permease subunit